MPRDETGHPASSGGDRRDRAALWLLVAALAAVAAALAARYGRAADGGWAPDLIDALLAGVLVWGAMDLRRHGREAVGLALYLESIVLVAFLVPDLVAGLTQPSGPGELSTTLGTVLSAGIAFGAFGLFWAGWDAPPVSGAVALGGAQLVLAATDAFCGSLSCPAGIWALGAYGLLLSLGAMLWSRWPSAQDHGLWVALSGLASLSLALPAAAPWGSPAGWIYLPVELLVAAGFWAVGRGFLGTLALLSAWVFLTVQAAASSALVGVLTGLVLLGLSLVLTVSLGQRLAAVPRPPHGPIWN